MTLPLITAADLPGYDPATADIVARLASGVVRDYCGWHIAPEVSETLTLDGNGATILPLPTLHLVAVTSVTVDGIDVTGDVGWTARGLLTRAAGWPTTWRSVVASILHGYTETPDAVKVVAMSAATRSLSNPEQVRSESVLGYSVVYTIPSTGQATALALTPAEQSILGHYQIPATP